MYQPAAHTSVPLVAETDVNRLVDPECGAGNTCHDDPFQ
jgi:hypothetical protein